MATTLLEVAKRAGVSLATASRVINGSTRSVGAELRQRVLDAAAELGYVPNAHAQALARSNAALVGVVVHDISDPYFAEIVRGIQSVADQSNRLVSICNSYRDPARDLAYVRLLHAHRAEALIMAGSGLDDREYSLALARQISAFSDAGGRVAFIGRHHVPGNAIVPDNVGGGRAVGHLLAALGHRQIGVVGGPPMITTSSDRLDGLRSGLRDYGIELGAGQIISGDFSREAGARAALELLAQHPRITAIHTLNDLMAVGALAALRERGVAVPGDITLVGFDDIPIAADVTPALSTVRVPMFEMGRRALDLALQSSSSELRVEHLATELIVRASSGPRA